MDQTESADTLDGSPSAEASAIVVARIGRYPILRKLGEGGMGVVYAAYDDLLDRKLAIKLLRPRSGSRSNPEAGQMDQRRARVLREAQGLARLSHANVVQIYEIGEHGEAVYMAMEFVAGQTLRGWLEQQPRSRAQILEVFTAAGRGLAAAHAARLIHRDFKPDNVMVADDGQVKVMDFGLVRAEGTSEPELDELTRSNPDASPEEIELTSSLSRSTLGVDLTKTGSVMGTPAYMAPEQHFGQPTDARSDQFSFCVALWEALYRVRPYAGESVAALVFNVTQGKIVEPPREAEVPGWLRKVIERGLAREPADRWPSMAALLEALERDPTRRRRSLLSLLTVGALAFGAWSWQRAEQARRNAAEQQARDACEQQGRSIDEVWSVTRKSDAGARERIGQAFARSKLAFADATWTRTRAIVDDYASAWATARTRVCIEAEIDAVLDPDTAALALACLDERKAALASLASLLADADEARILRAIPSATWLPPVADCADPRKLAQLPEDPRLRERVADLRERLMQIAALAAMGEYEAGAREAAAAHAEAESIGWPPSIAAAQLEVGRMASAIGDYAGARAAYEQAMEIAARAGEDTLVLDGAVALIYAVGVGQDKPDDGLRIAKLAELLLARLDRGGGLLEATLHNNLGAVHERGDRLDLALAEFERALAIYEAVLPPAHPNISIALNNIGTIHGRQGRLERALDYFLRTLAIREASLPPGHPRFAAAHENIGNVHAMQGSHELAAAAFERALAINEANLPAEHLDIANNLINLGNSHFFREDFTAAEPLFRRGLAIREAALPSESRLLGAAHNSLGLTLAGLGRREEAIEQLGRALEIYEVALAPADPRLAALLYDLARTWIAAGDPSRALPLLERAISIREGRADEEELAEARQALTEALASGRR